MDLEGIKLNEIEMSDRKRHSYHFTGNLKYKNKHKTETELYSAVCQIYLKTGRKVFLCSITAGMQSDLRHTGKLLVL